MRNPYVEQTRKHREQIVLEFAPVIKKIANRLAARLPSNFDIDDLIQTGMIGLMEAADRYDPSRENQFKTFAEYRIRGAMLDELRVRDWIPRSVRENSTKLEKAYTKLRADGVDDPDDQSLAEELEIKVQELPGFLDKSRPIPMLSIEDLGHHTQNDEPMNLLDTFSDPDQDTPIDELLGNENKELLIEAIKRLPEREQMVLSLYYTEDLNLKEIAAVLDLTESRVSQIRTKSIAMLRSYLHSPD